MQNIKKRVLVPVDGSENSLKTLDFLKQVFDQNREIEMLFFYVMPGLPPLFTENRGLTAAQREKLAAIKARNTEMAEKIMAEIADKAKEKGFSSDQVRSSYANKKMTAAQDIREYAATKQVDAIVLTRRGRTQASNFFMGEVSANLVEYCRTRPVWVLDGGIQHAENILIGLDASENALRALDHAGFMFAGTSRRLTLLHVTRHLRRFLPEQTLAADAEEMQSVWKDKSLAQLTPYIERAKETLLGYGFSPEDISVKIIDGGRSAGDDIVKYARENHFGTLVLGRRGLSMIKEFFMGGVTRKVLYQSVGLAVCITH